MVQQVRTVYCPYEPPLRDGEVILGSVLYLGVRVPLWFVERKRAKAERKRRRRHDGRLRKR